MSITETPQKQYDSPKSQAIQGFFESIANRYDFLNELLSFRLDERWRKKSRDIVLDPNQKSILDLGIGTGKFLNLFLEAKFWEKAAGLDFSENMLAVAREKVPGFVDLVPGDFHALPFEANQFDLVISSFTLRSVKDMPLFLKEIARILTPGGRAAFLCLTRPENKFWNALYYPYLKFYLPLIGGLFSGNKSAYQFLSDSILSFQEPLETVQMMNKEGFRNTQIKKFSFGMATLIVGDK